MAHHVIFFTVLQLMAKFMTAKHKKYLTKDPATPSANAAAANTSTGTVDSLGDSPDARRAAPQQSMVSSFDQQGYHTEEEDEEEDSEPLGVSEAFEPLSDLSMSSRDIRR